MNNIEIQSIKKLSDGSIIQNVYVLNNAGGRIMKFVCRVSRGEKLDDTIKKAKNYISSKGTKIVFNANQDRFAH